MKRKNIAILLGCMILLFNACRDDEGICMCYPTDRVEYFATNNNSMTYYEIGNTEHIAFTVGNISLSNAYTVPWKNDVRGLCQATAHQFLVSQTDTISFTKIGNAGIETFATKFTTEVFINAFGLFTSFSFDEPMRVYQFGTPPEIILYEVLPEWTAANGTRYTDVYHIDDEASGATFYLAPGYGIVQAVTPDKTYVLKTE